MFGELLPGTQYFILGVCLFYVVSDNDFLGRHFPLECDMRAHFPSPFLIPSVPRLVLCTQ